MNPELALVFSELLGRLEKAEAFRQRMRAELAGFLWAIARMLQPKMA